MAGGELRVELSTLIYCVWVCITPIFDKIKLFCEKVLAESGKKLHICSFFGVFFLNHWQK